MADFSIDQNRLPGVKEVCRDFAVLEDHTLAHSLQEQEIENHLASNIHKSRLVQQDLQVAKRLQEEEDLRAKARIQRRHKDIERSDNEIAQEIQEQLVRQAEKQRQQEEKDEAIARKLQEKEMKEERRRQKQLEPNFEEECYDEKGASQPPQDSSKGRHPERGPSEPTGGEHHECYPMGCRKSRYPKYYLPESGQGNYTKNSTVEPKMGRNHDFHSSDSSRGRDPEIVSAKRRKEWQHHGQESPVEAQGSQFSIYTSREEQRGRPTSHKLDKAVHWRERPAWSCVPQHIWERDKERKRWRHKEGYNKQARDRKGEWERARERDWEKGKGRTGGKSREQHRDGYGDKGRDDHKNWEFWDTVRAKDGDLYDVRPSTSKVWLAEEIPNWDNLGGRLKWQPWDGEVFEDYSPITSKRGDREEPRAPRKEIPRTRLHLGEDVPSRLYLPREKDKMTRGEYGMREATQGIARLDLREQELRDLEVARRLQEEELKASQMDKRAAQVAQDEEIARLLMEEEKKVYKRSRDREKPVVDKKRPEGDWKPGPEEVVRPRSQEEYNYQRPRNHKPDRELLHTHDYENMDSSYQYPTSHYSPRSSPGPETTCKGSYYRQ